MDVLMKGLSIGIGAYNAVFWRYLAGALLSGLLYFGTRPAWPDAATMRIHALRSLFVAMMALGFFWALARLPMAEAIALAKSEEHTSELPSLMRISYSVFCLTNKKVQYTCVTVISFSAFSNFVF